MSSHHIIRDKQEPALIIANGEACNFSLLEELLEWAPFIVVLDGAFSRVAELNIKVDVVLGDFDSLDTGLLKEYQDQIKVVHAPDQNKTDLEKGIDYLVEEGFSAANIVWATGKRADHTMANLLMLTKFVTKIQLKIIDNHSSIFALKPGEEGFEKWYLKGTPISLMPAPKACDIFSENLKYHLEGLTLEIPMKLGNSNEVEKDGLIKVSYRSGGLLIMECRDL